MGCGAKRPDALAAVGDFRYEPRTGGKAETFLSPVRDQSASARSFAAKAGAGTFECSGLLTSKDLESCSLVQAMAVGANRLRIVSKSLTRRLSQPPSPTKASERWLGFKPTSPGSGDFLGGHLLVSITRLMPSLPSDPYLSDGRVLWMPFNSSEAGYLARCGLGELHGRSRVAPHSGVRWGGYLPIEEQLRRTGHLRFRPCASWKPQLLLTV
jgi:hypothetical protein